MPSPELPPPPTPRRRPGNRTVLLFVLIWVAASALLAGGLFLYLGPAPRPTTDGLVVQVIATLPGVEVLEVETTLCLPIEARLRATEGAIETRATIVEGRVDVEIEFDGTIPEEEALGRVRAALIGVESKLPEAAGRPELRILGAPGDRIVTLALHGDAPFVLTPIAEEMAEEIRRLPRIRRVEVLGGSDRAVGVWFDLGRLRAWGLAPTDVLPEALEAISAASDRHLVRPAGVGAGHFELENLVLGTTPNGVEIRLRDVATIKGDSRARGSVAWRNGAPVVLLRVVCRDGGDGPLLEELVPRLRAELKPGLRLGVWREWDPDDSTLAAEWCPVEGVRTAGALRVDPGSHEGAEWILFETPGRGRYLLRGVDRSSALTIYLARLRSIPKIRARRLPPPGERPFRIHLQGDDIDRLAAAADDLIRHLPVLDVAENPVHDVPPQVTRLRMTVDDERAVAFGLSGSEVRRQIAMHTGGALIGEIGGAPLVAHLGSEQADRVENIGDVILVTAEGSVRASEIVEVELAPALPWILRRNGKRSATVYVPSSRTEPRELVLDLIHEALEGRFHEGVTVTIAD